MNKNARYLIALMTLGLSLGPAYASCDSGSGYTQLTGAQISTLLVGSIACYPASAPYENQEALAGGIITDYKHGPSDPIDPSKVIGGYSIGTGPDNKTITYTYTGGTAFTYTVWGTTTSGLGNYDFCVGSSPIAVRVAPGSGPC